MDRESAKAMRDEFIVAMAVLDYSVAIAERGSSKEEFHTLRRRVGKVMGEITIELLGPLIAEHPDLDPDPVTWREVVVQKLKNANASLEQKV